MLLDRVTAGCPFSESLKLAPHHTEDGCDVISRVHPNRDRPAAGSKRAFHHESRGKTAGHGGGRIS